MSTPILRPPAGHPRPRRPRPRRRGFSLIEVLMAVFILALGLLGLGAVFPVVIREQRQGHETVLGTTVAGSARALLQGYDYTTTGVDVKDLRDFWTRLRENTTDGLNDPDFLHGEWLVAEAEGGSGPAGIPGQVALPLNAPAGGPQLVLRLQTRLWPSPLPRTLAPQFVWDLAVQRVADGDGLPDNDGVRVAIFVRRLDPRIRVDPQLGLYRQLTAFTAPGAVPTADRRVPVAVGRDGLPALDGVGDPALEYANLRKVRVEFIASGNENALRDRLYFDTSDPAGGNPQQNVPWRLARQVGQKLVDNLGNVYTVVETGKTNQGREYVRVLPPVPASIPPTSEAAGSLPDLVCVREVLLSPQIPAAVLLWRAVQ